MVPFIKKNAFPLAIFSFIFIGLILKNYLMRNILFWDWDEGIYAQIAREVLQNKTFITTFNGTLWLDKPPLANILIAIMFGIFGESEFWARMLIVSLGCVLTVMTYFLTKKIMTRLFPELIKNKNKLQAEITYFIPVFVLLAFPIYLDRSTLLNTDVILAISWVGYLLFMDRFWIKLFFITVGVLSKSVLGFYPVLFEILTLKKTDLQLKNWYKPILLILVPLMWHIFAYLKWGSYFIEIHFINQMVKRVAVPIELHFGDKYYYLNFIWQSLGLLSIVLLIAYAFISFDLLKQLSKTKLKFIWSEKWRPYVFLFAAIPFFIFLNIGKSKIYWYVAIMTPLLAIPFAYLFYRLKQPILKYGLLLLIMGYSLYNFVPQTYLSGGKYTPPSKIQLAQCLAQKSGTKLAKLVDEEERKNKNFLEASHYFTNSSFLYGGSPSFVYYSRKKVDYFYDVKDFEKNLKNYPVLAVSKNDFENSKLNVNQLISEDYKKVCEFDTWLGFTK